MIYIYIISILSYLGYGENKQTYKNLCLAT